MENSEMTSQSVDLLKDLGEVTIDVFLEDGVLKEIPILGSVVGIAKLSGAISDRIFLSKIKKFLLHLDVVTENEKNRFYEDLDRNPKLKSKTTECLTLILDRLDDLDKISILSQLFVALIKKKIDLENFRRLASAIDLAFIEDLKQLINNSEDYNSLYNLIRSGLTETSSTGVPTQTTFGDNVVHISVRISKLGRLFLSLINEED